MKMPKIFKQIKTWDEGRRYERFLSERRRAYLSADEFQKDSKGLVREKSGIYAAQRHDPQLLWMIYLSISWVRACVDIITKDVLAEGWRLTGNKSNFKKVDDILLNPNPQDDGDEILQNISEDTLLYGSSYLELVKDGFEKLAEIYTLDGTITRTGIDDHGKIEGYSQLEGKGAQFAADEVALFRLSTKGGGVLGTSPLDSLIVTVETDLHAQSYNRSFFKNAARPRGMFWSETATRDQVQRNREYLKVEASGPQNAHKDMFLEGKMEHKDLQKTPQDIEFLGLRKFNREEILAVYGVPPAKIGIIEAGNLGGGTGETQNQTFKNEVVRPQQRRIGRRFTRTVIRDTMGIDDVKFEFISTDPVGDKQKAEIDETRSKTFERYINLGVMTVAQVQEAIGQKVVGAIAGKSLEKLQKQEEGDIPDSAIPVKKRRPANWLEKDEGFIETKKSLLDEIEKQKQAALDAIPEAIRESNADVVANTVDTAAMTAALTVPVSKSFDRGYAQGEELSFQKQVEGEFGPRPGDFAGIENQVTVLIDDFSSELRVKLASEVGAGIQAGEGVAQIADRVSSVYAAPRTFQTATGSRTLSNEVWASLTSRKETLGALNESRRVSMERLGIVKFDVLLAAGAEVECRIVASEGPYSSEDAKGLLPVHPNCRCSLIPTTEE